MCLIIASRPLSKRLTKEEFILIKETNNDGLGIAYNDKQNNTLIVKKDFASLDEFYDFYLNIPPESSILVHFRKCSSGSLIPENLHPFTVNQNLCFAFNGTISALNWDKERSDTFLLNESIIKPLHRNSLEIYKTFAFKTLLEKYIDLSKMVFLDNLGELIFINEVKGDWNEAKDVWVSNLIWKNKKAPVVKVKNESPLLLPPIPTEIAKLSHLGSTDLLKKKYCRVGDPHYKTLSLEEINELYHKNKRKGIKKLIRKQVIRPLEEISDTILYNAKQAQLEEEYKQKQLSGEQLTAGEKIALSVIQRVKDQKPLTSSIGEIMDNINPS